LNARVGYEAYRSGEDPDWDQLPKDVQERWELAASAIARTAEARAKEERSAVYGRCSHCHRALVEIGVLDGVPAFACPDRADADHQAQIPTPAGGVRLTVHDPPG
jgi:hypothetical protein